MFCLNLMRIALELASENPVYEGLATKFFQHYVYVAAAMKHMGGRDYQLWDDEDGFFYDVLRYPDGRSDKFRVRSLVGLIPLFAVERLETSGSSRSRSSRQPQLVPHEPPRPGRGRDPPVRAARRQDDLRADDRRHDQLRRLLERTSMTSASSSRATACAACRRRTKRSRSSSTARRVELRAGRGGREDQGRQLELARADLVPDDVPADRVAAQARQGVRTGLPHRRRRALATSRSRSRTMARDIARRHDRHLHCATRTAGGRCTAARRSSRTIPHWRDHLLFYEYFHGDNGAGLGASHQTGWTALVANADRRVALTPTTRRWESSRKIMSSIFRKKRPRVYSSGCEQAQGELFAEIEVTAYVPQ